MRAVLFVCTANLCRSPMAEGAFRRLLARQGLEGEFEVDSAGTHDMHAGQPPYFLAQQVTKERGYEIGRCVARRIRMEDFDRFDHILVMDRANLSQLRRIAPTRAKPKIELLLEYGDAYYGQEVPDPFRGTEADFQRALDMIEDGCEGLLQLLVRTA